MHTETISASISITHAHACDAYYSVSMEQWKLELPVGLITF